MKLVKGSYWVCILVKGGCRYETDKGYLLGVPTGKGAVGMKLVLVMGFANW